MDDTTEISTTTVYETLSLTTIFTTPSFCASRSYTVSDVEIITLGLTRPMRDCVSSTWTPCAPPEIKYMHCDQNNDPTTYTSYWGIISPGVCPGDQTVVDTTVYMYDGETTTFAGCCPTGWTYDGLACLTDFQPTEVVYMTSDSDLQKYQVAGTLSIHPDSIITKSASAAKLEQYVLSVAWQESDLPRFTPASAPLYMLSAFASSTGGGSVSGVSRPTGSRSGTTSTPTGIAAASASGAQDNGLTSTQKLGLTVGGVLLGVLLLCFGIAFFLWRSTKRARQRAKEVGG